MTVLGLLADNYVNILFFITIVIIVLFTELSIDKIVLMIGLVGAAIILYKTVHDSSSMLIVGLMGIILVLLFALASGVGRAQKPVIIKEDCKPKPFNFQLQRSKNCPVSGLAGAGICPTGYTNFTDGEGNTLCCASSNIDPYAHKCPASGPTGICSMAPGLEDPRSPPGEHKLYPMCQNLRQEQSVVKGLTLCPRRLPNYLQSSVNSYKCCATVPGASAANCPDPNNSCSSLFGNQTILNTPDSCEAIKLQSIVTCPVGTSLNPRMQITDPKTKQVVVVPSCQGVTNTCYPRKVLEKCKQLGGCSRVDFEHSLSNCEVYNSIFNDRTKDINQVDITGVDFFR